MVTNSSITMVTNSKIAIMLGLVR